MANQLLTSDKITKRAAAVLHENLTLVGVTNKQYDSQFRSSGGGKPGDQMRWRKPPRFLAGEGAAATVQDVVDEYAYFGVYKQFHVLVDFTSRELTLSIDDFETQILRPAMATLASQVEQYAFDVAMANAGTCVIGSGTGGAITWKDIVRSGAILDQNAIPRDKNRHLIINPMTQVNVLDETKGLFNAQEDIGDQYRDGVIGRSAGFLFASSSRAPVLNIPGDVAGTVSAAYTEGSTTISVTGLATNTQYPAGVAFTVANVYAVHPQTKQSLGRLYHFVARSAFTTDGSGSANVTIWPVYAADTGRKNVTALPANNAAVNIIGSASTSYRQSLALHRDAFAFVTADLELPEGGSRVVMDGISLRFASQWVGQSDKHIKRFDVLCGFAPIYPEMAVKLIEPNT